MTALHSSTWKWQTVSNNQRRLCLQTKGSLIAEHLQKNTARVPQLTLSCYLHVQYTLTQCHSWSRQVNCCLVMTIYWETGHFPCFAYREGGMSQRLEFVLKREIITSEQVFPRGMAIKPTELYWLTIVFIRQRKIYSSCFRKSHFYAAVLIYRWSLNSDSTMTRLFQHTSRTYLWLDLCLIKARTE